MEKVHFYIDFKQFWPRKESVLINTGGGRKFSCVTESLSS